MCDVCVYDVCVYDVCVCVCVSVRTVRGDEHERCSLGRSTDAQAAQCFRVVDVLHALAGMQSG